MSSLEERVAFLEGKVEEHSRGFGELQESIGRTDGHVLSLDRKVDRFRQELSARIDGLAARIDGLDQKIDRFRDELSVRIEALVNRMDRMDNRLNARIDGLEARISRQFTWIVGIQVAMFLALIGSFLTLFGSLVQR